ncbi:MAG: hypothetical protein RO009_24020 [Pseudorhodoplanes sp.]|jgi:hypothetical protein|nr:hypothetical protein [Pseudorhodoplanes sp.]
MLHRAAPTGLSKRTGRWRAGRMANMCRSLTQLLLSGLTTALAGAALIAVAMPAPASACACCTNPGARLVATEKLDAHRLGIVERLAFGKTAQRYGGEADDEDSLIDGAGPFALMVQRQKDRLVFTFRNKQGQTGAATLVLPRSISIFEVDPHGERKDAGLGPSLYKEWTLTTPATVSGILQRAGGTGQSISLILHGGGNACTDESHFTDWTLHFRGPKGQTIVFGPLQSGAR